jgi:fructooligosaccharide transport system permease protein
MNTTLKYQNQKKILGVLFAMPALIFLGTFLVLPVLMAFYYSFLDYNILKPQNRFFVGLGNYWQLFHDAAFFSSLKNTVYFTVLVVPLQSLTALVLALLINKKVRIAPIGRILFFSPVITSMVIVTILWTFLFNVERGPINSFLNVFGIPDQPFLLSVKQAMNSIIFMSIWQSAGFQMMIFLAGLKEVPHVLYEAADIDGSNAWQKFWHVTWPSISHVTSFVLLITTIQAFRLFIQPFVMTYGGPNGATKTLVFLLYEAGFQFRNVGYSCSISMIFFLIVLSISILMRKYIVRE